MEINHVGLGLEMQHFYDKLCVYTLQQSNSSKNYDFMHLDNGFSY